jgi:hypothetical protein
LSINTFCCAGFLQLNIICNGSLPLLWWSHDILERYQR